MNMGVKCIEHSRQLPAAPKPDLKLGFCILCSDPSTQMIMSIVQ